MIELIIFLAAAASLVIIVARRFPDLQNYIRSLSGGVDEEVKMHRFETSSQKPGRLQKVTSGPTDDILRAVFDQVKILVAERKFKEAESLLIEQIEHDPKNPKIYNELGVVYLEDENFSDAKEAFKTALKYDKHNDLFYNNLGLALFNQGRYIEAIEAYQRSIQLNGLVPHRYINLGLAYAALRQYEKALDMYKKARVLDKDNEQYEQLIAEVSDKIAELRGME
ncbi:MAG: tetratricopeptide repeat protein [Patescibacteria group bacterium]